MLKGLFPVKGPREAPSLHHIQTPPPQPNHVAKITQTLERLALALEVHEYRPKVPLNSQTETHAMYNQGYGAQALTLIREKITTEGAELEADATNWMLWHRTRSESLSDGAE